MSTTYNVDPSEIAKFEKLAARWWDPEGDFKPLHDINPLRIDFINTRAPLQGKRVLDVGCGGGILAEAMTALGAQVTAIDAGTAPLAVAVLHSKKNQHDIEYISATAEEHAAKNPDRYDVITCLEMLEHVPDPASVISACAKMIKPDGDLFFSTINRHPKAWLFAVIGAEYVLRLLPRGTHDYLKFIKPSELARALRQSHLNIKELTGMHYNPLTRRYRLSDGLEVNYLAHAKANAS